MSNYAKFLKDIIRLGDFEIVDMTTKNNMLIQHKMAAKMKDPGSFNIPCYTGEVDCGQALCDLGVNINLMPKSIFRQLRIGQSKPTVVNLQPTNKSLVHQEGKIDGAMVQVDNFVILADFIIFEYEVDADIHIL